MATSRPSGIESQIPRNALALLMVAQAAVVAPHAMQLSPWIIVVCFVCGCWRTLVYQGRWAFPSRAVKAALVVCGSVGVVLSSSGGFSLEAFVSLLVLAFGFKLVEMKSRRDAYVVIFMAYFVVAAEFLFDQSLFVAVYEFVAVIIVTAAMVGLNQMRTRVRPMASARLALSLMMQALPLTVVLFLFFPRVMPLWSVPVPGNTPIGLQEEIEPGDLTGLTQSDAVAFRVVFDDGPPPFYRELYWRGVVYNQFENGRWRMAPPQFGADIHLGTAEQGAYEVMLEPTAQNWLYGLAVPTQFDNRARLTRDMRLITEDPVLSVTRYRLSSAPGARFGLALSEAERALETHLPDVDENPRLAAFARDLYRREGDEQRFAQALLEHIRAEPYAYTLKPPALGEGARLDAFWFDTRSGFCAHYASAFVYAMRSVGIPARMVGGYLGGEINPLSDHIVVRQYDAHAWAEVWLEGQGWQRFDPTGAVAPERVEQGLAAALSSQDRLSLSALTNARFGEQGLVGRLLYMFDSVDHNWNMFVVGFDGGVQEQFLSRWLGDLTPARVGLTMLVLGALCLGLTGGILFLRRRPKSRHPAVRLYERFVARAARLGLQRQAGETPGAFVRRAGLNAGVESALIEQLAQQLEAALYDPDAADDSDAVRAGLRRLALRMTFATR